jgi:3-oxoadipate enol-lactonase
MPYIELPAGRFFYREDGPRDAPPLVLSNSLGTDHTMWDAQIPALTQHFRVVRYDGRGHGASAVPAGPYTIVDLGQDVVALCEALGIGRAHFCGLSLGGMVGMCLAANAPERVDRLILCDTAARLGPPEYWDARIEAVRAGGMSAIALAVLARWFTESFLSQFPTVIEQVRHVLANTPASGYIACCEAIRDMDQRASLSRIQAQTLVIAGAFDAATPPEDGRFLATAIPNARYEELPAAHLSNIEASAAFTDAVTRFLSAV